MTKKTHTAKNTGTTASGSISATEKQALQMLRRKNGATIDQICTKLALDDKQARSALDRLRAKGFPVERIGKCQFRSPAKAAKAPARKRKSH